jgi:hypothetical protein
VDAGADAFGPIFPYTMEGIVTVGTDLTPDILWTVVSGAGGTFDDPTSPTAVFTRGPQGGLPNTVLVLTATPDDGPPVADTMTMFYGG